MPEQIVQVGDQFIARLLANDVAQPAQIDVGLYDDGVDSIGDGNTITDITTEPGDGNYTRQSVSLPADVTVSGGTITIPSQTFDTTNTTQQNVDAIFLVVDADNDSAVDELLGTALAANGDTTVGGSVTEVNTGDITISIE